MFLEGLLEVFMGFSCFSSFQYEVHGVARLRMHFLMTNLRISITFSMNFLYSFNDQLDEDHDMV